MPADFAVTEIPTKTSPAVQALPDEAQCLFLRLFLRKGPWFRLNTLAYSELTDIPTSAHQLCHAGMATPLYSASLPDTSPAIPSGRASQAAAVNSPAGPAEDTSPSAANSTGFGDQCSDAVGCRLAEAASCPGQLVCEVAEALTVAELQLLMSKLELGVQGRSTGISKGQMLQLLKAGLEKVQGLSAEVGSCQNAVLSCF